MKIKRGEHPNSPDHEDYFFDCPGCGMFHSITVKWGTAVIEARKKENPKAQFPAWEFNGSLEKPTFKPSLLCRWRMKRDENGVCHSFITDGQIQFLPDCTHHLAGKTVSLPEVSE